MDPLSFPSLGDDLVAYRVIIPFSTQGVTVEIYDDFVMTHVGNVGITADFQSQLAPFDTDQAAELTQVMVDRAQTATQG